MIAGQFDLPGGFEHWLLKFDGTGNDQGLGPSQQYGRIEYAYSRMATWAGVTMQPCRLYQEGGRAHFMTRRFDRDGNDKVHVQSLCALRHMSYNQVHTHAYESLFLAARDLGLGDAEMTQLFARMAFNVTARNQDDHTRNFAFLMRRETVETRKLSRAAIETLAIVAYHQPVTRAEIEEIRGVGVSRGTIDQLLELDWIRLGRRRMTPGRPVTFVVTEAFLDHFGLESARDLPGLKELRAAGLLDNRPPPEGEDDGTDPGGEAGQDDMFDPGAEPDRGG